MEEAGGWLWSENIFEGKHKYINLSQILECRKLYLYLKKFGDDELHVYFLFNLPILVLRRY